MVENVTEQCKSQESNLYLAVLKLVMPFFLKMTGTWSRFNLFLSE